MATVQTTPSRPRSYKTQHPCPIPSSVPSLSYPKLRWVPTPCGSEITHTHCTTAAPRSCRRAVARRRHHRAASCVRPRPPPRSPFYLMASRLPPPRRRSWTLVFEIERTNCKATEPRRQEELDTRGEFRPRGFRPLGAQSAVICP